MPIDEFVLHKAMLRHLSLSLVARHGRLVVVTRGTEIGRETDLSARNIGVSGGFGRYQGITAVGNIDQLQVIFAVSM